MTEDDLPPSGKIINEVFERSGLNRAMHDIERNEADHEGRVPYKRQTPEQRSLYFAQDAAYAWVRMAAVFNPLWGLLLPPPKKKE